MVRLLRDEEAADKFATDRSHKASEIAYDLCKVTAQACLLINGGAATAVIALLSKDKIDPTLFRVIPFCLGGYGLGVLVSAVMMFCVMMNADYWNYHWYYIAYARDNAEAENAEKVANRWHIGFYFSFGAAVVCFLGASALLANAILKVPVPMSPGA